MKKSRLEAFSDGVLAIIIVFIGIYWNNHHHLWHVVEQVNS